MFSRIRRSFNTSAIVTLACTAALLSRAADDPNTDNAEAQRLYSRANDYVSHVNENGYSYAYIQFYWKRAQSYIDRVARVYPQTPIGHQIIDGQIKIGPYELTYFKERVLPRLEEKKLAAFDAVNCSIFLYGLDENRWDETRVQAMESIIEVLARQKRWAEALSASFPVLAEYRPRLMQMVIRIAARYQQTKLVDELVTNTPADQQKYLWPILGEAMALTGENRDDIAKFLDEHPQDEVKLAILSGMIQRELGIQRAATLRQKTQDGIQKTHYSILKPEVRDNIDSVAATFFPSPTAESQKLVASYHAGLGQKPTASADVSAHLAYLEYLEVAARFEELAKYDSQLSLSDTDRQACDLKTIELLAEGARDSDSASLRTAYAAKGGALADAAIMAAFRGHMDSLDAQLTVSKQTFVDLGLKDPCLLAQAICEWSLTPNRSIRGEAPWDPIVQKYWPGFDNLPLPKSKEVQDAAGTSKPF